MPGDHVADIGWYSGEMGLSYSDRTLNMHQAWRYGQSRCRQSMDELINTSRVVWHLLGSGAQGIT